MESIISIHALLAESDLGNVGAGSRMLRFLSTLSLRRATVGASQGANIGHISIHALLAESDILPGRLGFLSFPFLSTLSLRRATGGNV